jgi:hypothetical protein
MEVRNDDAKRFDGELDRGQAQIPIFPAAPPARGRLRR